MNFFKTLLSRRIINIQYNPRVSNSLKRCKAINLKPKLRKLLDWILRQWLVALIMHLHCFESACNCKFHYTMNSYNAWLLSEYVPKNVLMYQVSITITMDRLTAVSANLKVSSKRKLRLTESANGKLLCSVSVPHFYGKESTKNLNRSVDVGLPQSYPSLSTFSEHLRKAIKRYMNSWCSEIYNCTPIQNNGDA